jgi:ferredoxin
VGTFRSHSSVRSAIPKISVNRQRCQGHARCAALAPELFAVDEFGEGRAIGDGIVSAHLHDKAHLAKANCPEAAIDIEEG